MRQDRREDGVVDVVALNRRLAPVQICASPEKKGEAEYHRDLPRSQQDQGRDEDEKQEDVLHLGEEVSVGAEIAHQRHRASPDVARLDGDANQFIPKIRAGRQMNRQREAVHGACHRSGRSASRHGLRRWCEGHGQQQPCQDVHPRNTHRGLPSLSDQSSRVSSFCDSGMHPRGTIRGHRTLALCLLIQRRTDAGCKERATIAAGEAKRSGCARAGCLRSRGIRRFGRISGRDAWIRLKVTLHRLNLSVGEKGESRHSGRVHSGPLWPTAADERPCRRPPGRRGRR